MCGIAGWIDCRRLCDSAAIMRRMAQTMVPRGPDSGGFYTDDNCALAHRRLSVIDPARSAQPMTRKTALDSYTIVYNGELYNTAEIRSELESTGISFTSSGDTEVLLWAYITWGEACLDKLNGIYAFAVWQEKEKQLFLARDRIGVKPLFYYEYAGGLIFASEIKTLLAHPMIEPVVDRDGIAQIMLLGPARKPGSGIFKGIRELRPAECAMYCRCGLRKRTYWSLHPLPHKETAEETEQHIAYLLTDAIKRQLVSDVPLCTMLSGGLDSSIISAVAAREFEQSGRQLTTYSIDYKDNDKNFHSSKFQPDMDAPWIRKMSAFIGSKHINVEVDTPALTDTLELSTYARDLPGMADVDSSLYLFCKAIKGNFTVALSGECADEIFGGYPWYHNEEILYRPGFPWACSTASRADLLCDGILGDIDPNDYVNFCCNETLKNTEYLDTDSRKDRRMREMFMLNFYWFMQCLLDRKDRMSMAHGLEVRVPFCDHRIARYAFNIPWEIKAAGGREKGIVRRAMKGILPDDVLWRKKSPYPKTHNPTYLAEVIRRMRAVLADKDCRLTEIVSREKLLRLCDDPTLFEGNWYGQLMTSPQIFAYLLQIEYWLRRYDVRIDRQ